MEIFICFKLFSLLSMGFVFQLFMQNRSNNRGLWLLTQNKGKRKIYVTSNYLVYCPVDKDCRSKLDSLGHVRTRVAYAKGWEGEGRIKA